MRPALALSAVGIVLATCAAHPAEAQTRRGQERDRQPQQQQERPEKDASWNAPVGQLEGTRNVGPCPFVKVLYDAHRYVEFQGGREASATVGFSGEIEGISANCVYQGEDPIAVDMNIGFHMGRGPQAAGDSKNYNYWIAVTRRNREILAKEFFTVPVRFAPGQDRVVVNERISGIVIPRATATTSGSNFEILVGFDVTPEMAEFNRDGKRFRVNATPATAAAPPTTPPPSR